LIKFSFHIHRHYSRHVFIIFVLQKIFETNPDIMKALVPEKYKELVYKDVPDPDIKSNEVLIRVMACCLV